MCKIYFILLLYYLCLCRYGSSTHHFYRLWSVLYVAILYFFGSPIVRTQGFELAKSVLYHLNLVPRLCFL
jgi:hypothetical protein